MNKKIGIIAESNPLIIFFQLLGLKNLSFDQDLSNYPLIFIEERLLKENRSICLNIEKKYSTIFLPISLGNLTEDLMIEYRIKKEMII